MITPRVHYQDTGVRTACGVKVFPHDQPTRMVLRHNRQPTDLQLKDVTCQHCRESFSWQHAVLDAST